MNRPLVFIFFCLLFISCNKNPTEDCQETTDADGTVVPCTDPAETGGETTTPPTTPEPTPEPTPTPTPTPTPPAPVTDVPLAASTWNADIYFVGFNAAQEEKVRKAVELIKKVIASSEFRTRILNHTYNGKKTFVDNAGFTNQEIYQKILDAAEKMGDTSKNNTMNVELELYYAATTTIGYTYPNVTRIWMNTKYFDKYTPVKVADNLTHEWTHKLGFGHASSYSTSRDYSVPYAVGYLVEELAAKIK